VTYFAKRLNGGSGVPNAIVKGGAINGTSDQEVTLVYTKNWTDLETIALGSTVKITKHVTDQGIKITGGTLATGGFAMINGFKGSPVDELDNPMF
jgi:hypothetical protein